MSEEMIETLKRMLKFAERWGDLEEEPLAVDSLNSAITALKQFDAMRERLATADENLKAALEHVSVLQEMIGEQTEKQKRIEADQAEKRERWLARRTELEAALQAVQEGRTHCVYCHRWEHSGCAEDCLVRKALAR